MFDPTRGTCEMIAKSYAKTFAPACASIEALTGNALANRMPDLKKVAASFDVLVICTSSYGSGDPPSNFGNFVKLLCHEASMRSDALTGMQHAVLGFGSTTCECHASRTRSLVHSPGTRASAACSTR